MRPLPYLYDVLSPEYKCSTLQMHGSRVVLQAGACRVFAYVGGKGALIGAYPPAFYVQCSDSLNVHLLRSVSAQCSLHQSQRGHDFKVARNRRWSSLTTDLYITVDHALSIIHPPAK